MSKQPLGKLTQVELREHWENEAAEFTPWMAQEENLELLGEAINIGLELQGTEESVGPFSADMVCKNTSDDSIVLIENQLERTDHRHLGQILTYAAGVGAKTVVWVAKEFTEQHRSAIDWINRITNEDFEAYGVVVELWRIDNSPLAPKFHVVAKPNDWSRTVRERAMHASPGTVSAEYLDYWREFTAYLEARGSNLRPDPPEAKHWICFPIGKPGVWFTAEFKARDRKVSAKIDFRNKAGVRCHDLLKEQAVQIDRELGEPVTWVQKGGGNQYDVGYWRDADPSNQATWPELHQWTCEKLEALERVFRKRIDALPPRAPNSDIGQP